MLFFSKGTVENLHQDENCTQQVWVYDLRANMPSFGKRTPFSGQYLKPFEDCFHAIPRDESYGQIDKLSRHSGRDCRNPEHKDVESTRHPGSLDPGNPCRGDDETVKLNGIEAKEESNPETR